MNAKNISTLKKGGHMHSLSRGKRFVRRYAQGPAYHAFARNSDQKLGWGHAWTRRQGTFDFRQSAKQLIVLRNGLCESESGIDYPALDTRIICLACKTLKIADYIFCHILVISHGLHGFRSSPLMHCYIFQPQTSGHRKHVWIILPCRYIVYDEISDLTVRLFNHKRPIGVNGNPCMGERIPYRLENRLQTSPLFLCSDRD